MIYAAVIKFQRRKSNIGWWSRRNRRERGEKEHELVP
jgi:hypothetical protein